MTAADKAHELGNKFYEGEPLRLGVKAHSEEIERAKQRAKTCVKEIIEVLGSNCTMKEFNFWNDVISEIEAL